MIKIEKYHEFLQLGYISTMEDSFKLNFKTIENLNEYNEVELIHHGKELLIKEIEKNIKGKSELLVPISAGLDSRLILSAISECRDLSEVNTLTYGTKGSLDYEIGNQIAKKMRTNHKSVDLMEHTFKLDDLYQFAQNIDRPTVLFHNIPYSELNQNQFDLLVSGFLGDVVSGKRFNYTDWQKEKIEVKKEYFESMFNRQNFSINNKELLDKLLNETIEFDIDKLTKKEIVYIKEHNLKININQVYAAFNNIDIYTPFYNTEFMNFLISIPNKYRENQYLYKKIIFENLNKQLANLPVKNFYGTSYYSNILTKNITRVKNSCIHNISKKINFVNSPYTNYVDFKKKIIKDYEFQTLILDLLNSLKSRRLYMYDNHINKSIYQIEKNQIDNPYNLLLLASLEIYIRMGKMI